MGQSNSTSNVNDSTAPTPDADVNLKVAFDYVVTTIDVVEKGDVDDSSYGAGAKYVEFDGKIKHRVDDDDVALLLNVRVKEEKDDSIIFEAIKVSLETFRDKLIAENKKLLACVHGFTVEPEKMLEQCSKIQNNDAFHHKVIPVIWPSVGAAGLDISIKYDREQAIAYQAGKALASLADIGADIHLSLMCHSMGNRVLLSYVQNSPSVEKKFDNVFMVAADVWEEVFNNRVIKNICCQPPWNYCNLWKDSGLHLCNMLKDDGKIHIVSNPGDRALLVSEYWENWRRRLGRFGKNGQGNRIHEDCIDKLEAFDAGRFKDEIEVEDRAFKHSYEAMPPLVQYYNDVLSKEYIDNP